MPSRLIGPVFNRKPGPPILEQQRLGVATVQQEHYRFRNDDGTEITATWSQPLDTPHPALPIGIPFRIRFAVANRGDTAKASVAYKCQYRRNGVDPWLPVTSSADVRGYTASSNAAAITRQIYGPSDGFSSTPTLQSGNSTQSFVLFGPGNVLPATEFEVSIFVATAVPGDVFEFRIGFNTNNEALQAYPQNASAIMVAVPVVTRPLPLGLSPGRLAGPPILRTQEPLVPVVSGDILVSLTAAAETDTARTLSFTKDIVMSLTPATETDTARALSVSHITALSPAAETDTAQTLTLFRAVDLIKATETDAAQALSFSKTIFMSLTQALETDAAQALVVAGIISVAVRPLLLLRLQPGRVAGPPVLIRQRPLEPAVFTSISLTPATETDTARPLTGTKTAVLVAAVETDTARTLTVRKELALVTASETDTAQALGLSKTVGVTKATETDTARTLTYQHSLQLGAALETDTARGFTYAKSVTVTPAAETDFALAFSTTRPTHQAQGPTHTLSGRMHSEQFVNLLGALVLTSRTRTRQRSGSTGVLTGTGETHA